MAKDLKFTITAQDDTSSVLAKISSSAKKEMAKVDDAFDQSKSKGKQAADALIGLFGALDAELAETKTAADMLAQAMGPELAAKVDSTAMVAEFQRMGLSIDEVKADADALAAALKSADDVTLKHFSGEVDRAGDSTRRLGGEADQSRSVMANMVGNSVQDISALGGVAGTAGMALGQLGEYAAEGNIKIGNLVKLAGPMIGVGLAVQGVTGHFKELARVKAFDDDAIRTYVDALRDGGDAAGELADRLREAGEIKFLNITGDEGDLTPKLAAAGVSVDQWTQLVTGSRDELNAWAEASVAAGGDVSALREITLAAMQEQDRYTKAQEQAAIQAKVFGREVNGAALETQMLEGAVGLSTRAYDDNKDAVEDNADATEANTRKLEAHKSWLDRAREARERLTDATMAATESMFDDERATLNAEQAYSDYEVQLWNTNTAIADGTLKGREKDDANRALRESELQVADQAWASAEAFAASQQEAGNSADKASLMRVKLQELKEKFPGLRDEIQAYIDALNRIPSSKTTNIITRTSTVTASGAPARNFIKPEERAVGGPVRAGEPYLVGENGPEVIVPAANGTVIPNGNGSGGVGVGMTVNLTVNAGLGTNGPALARQIDELLQQHWRRNGRGA